MVIIDKLAKAFKEGFKKEASLEKEAFYYQERTVKGPKLPVSDKAREKMMERHKSTNQQLKDYGAGAAVGGLAGVAPGIGIGDVLKNTRLGPAGAALGGLAGAAAGAGVGGGIAGLIRQNTSNNIQNAKAITPQASEAYSMDSSGLKDQVKGDVVDYLKSHSEDSESVDIPNDYSITEAE